MDTLQVCVTRKLRIYLKETTNLIFLAFRCLPQTLIHFKCHSARVDVSQFRKLDAHVIGQSGSGFYPMRFFAVTVIRMNAGIGEPGTRSPCT